MEFSLILPYLGVRRSFFLNNFVYLFLAVLGLHCFAWAFSSCSEWGWLVLPAECRLLFAMLLLKLSTGSRHAGFSSCSLQALGNRFRICGTLDLAALRHVGSTQTWDRTHVLCIGRWILIHCATREVTYQVHIKKIY